jgi:integrase
MPKRSGEPPLYRRNDSPYWWTWIYEGARRIKVSTKCTDRTAAKQKAVELHSMIVGKILGHASGQQVERIYGRLNLDSLRGAMELV